MSVDFVAVRACFEPALDLLNLEFRTWFAIQ